MLRSLPLSPLGWVALLAALGSAVLAVVALRLPEVSASPCAREEVHVLPSGREARLCEVLTETQPFTEEDWLVLRLVVPDLAPVQGDHADQDWVCERIGLSEASTAPRPPARVVVQLMAEAFPRGEPAPGITQSIEAYSLRDGVCIWELL
ncbi:DUF6497 family protein [Roseicyclus sp.]|uniref:DUF6497 family protein n=1 Tax=Roseicyclus sp. TaxID=1914329 RepID=UPI003FA0D6F6